MGFHLSNLFCRFKRTGFFFVCFFCLFCLFVCFFLKVSGIATKNRKTCVILKYTTVSITILGHWRRGPKRELRYFIYFLFL